MDKVEQNALRIAELLGYELVPSPLGTGVYFHLGDRFTQNEIRRLYSSYQGLMPIVFECNNDTYMEMSIYPASIQLHHDRIFIFDIIDKSNPIEAIQLACIKYLELKNG
jgi:hypothetical protein